MITYTNMIKTTKDEQKRTQEQVFQETIENQTKQCEDWNRILDVLWFQVGYESHSPSSLQ